MGPNTGDKVASNLLGNLHEFQPKAGSFSVYLERVKIFAVNNIPTEKRYQCF